VTTSEVIVTVPTPAPTPAPTGPACTLCGAPAVVNWRRRLTDDELDAHVALEQEKRDQRLLLADPQQPAPDYGPLPTAADCTAPVYACGPHAIAMDAAALVHAKGCTAPAKADLPGCDCTPEALPASVMAAAPMASRLPEHWTTGGG
jgi:hypothetical protein